MMRDVSVSIESTTLSAFLEEIGLAGFFDDHDTVSDEDWEEETENEDEDEEEYQLSNWYRDALDEICDEYQILSVELKPSPALSLLEILNAIGNPWWGGDDEAKTLEKLKGFLKANSAAIDKEAECSIIVAAEDPEDGFAYYQKLEASKGHGRLLQWPRAKGWTEEGYAAIQKFNEDKGGGIWDRLDNIEAMPGIAEKEGDTTVF